MSNYLVMLQTNSNQSFIFSSPRLREQIGASFEITLLSKWVKDKAEELLDTKTLPSSFWVSDSSGKVIVRFTETDGDPKDLARRLIREVTLRALTDAPGLDVTGVFIKATSNTVCAEDLQELDRVFLEYSLNRRPAAARFPQFPFLERGSESALPASPKLSADDCREMRHYARETLNVPLLTNDDTNFSPPTQTDQDAQDSLSLPSRIKRAWSRSARRLQLQEVVSRWAPDAPDTWPKEIERLNEDPFQLEGAFQDLPQAANSQGTPASLSSVGVIHIDGNGVGAIMRDLDTAHTAVKTHLGSLEPALSERKSDDPKANPCEQAEDPFQWFIMEVNYRLDDIVKEAVARSWGDIEYLANDDDIDLVPVVPVLVGGDDVTVYTDGRYAIPFAEAYIHHYEELTKDDDLLSVLAIVAAGKKADAPERDHFEIGDYIIQKPGPLTASAGVAIVGRNFPFHIAYDLAEELVKRGKKLGKKPGTAPCSTIDFHVLRDATVLDPEDTLNEYKGRTQRPFLIGHYAPQRIGDATTTSSEETPATTSQPLSSWARILQAVAAFDGKAPDNPTQTTGDPFPRARANRIVKLLAEGKEDQATTEWDDALQNAPSAGLLTKQLKLLPPQSSSSDGIAEALEQIKWLLDLIDLSGILPDGYLASRINSDADGADPEEAADNPTEGGAK
ncbi:MAG: hypothetical protein E6340_04575 [Actinomyces sp.]|nr:hypothetical protein [Actinomyces sp.]